MGRSWALGLGEHCVLCRCLPLSLAAVSYLPPPPLASAYHIVASPLLAYCFVVL